MYVPLRPVGLFSLAFSKFGEPHSRWDEPFSHITFNNFDESNKENTITI